MPFVMNEPNQALKPNARACGVVNHIRVDPDDRWSGETLDGVGMVKALQAQCTLDARTRGLLVGAGGVGRAIAVFRAVARAGISHLQKSEAGHV